MRRGRGLAAGFVIAIALSLLLPVLALAASPTCVTGIKGAAPAATITFTPPTAQADGSALPAGTALTYNLYQGTSSGTEVKVASTTSGSPITVSTGITSAVTYYWYVTTSDTGGESAPSNEVCKILPASPPGTVTITIL